MSERGGPDTADEQAAAITLYVNEAVVSQDGAGPVTSYILPPDSAAISFDRAVERLMDLVKPVRCVGRRAGEQLVLSCDRLVDSTYLALRAYAVARSVADTRRMMREAQQSGHQRDRIELHAGPDRLLLSIEGYERWREDYDLGNHVMGMSYASGSDGRVGIVWNVLRTDGVRVTVKFGAR